MAVAVRRDPPAPPLRALFGDPRQRAAWRRYWVRDVFFGALDLGLHHGFRLLPIDACSAIGGWLGELAGRWRFRQADRRARDNFLRIRPETPPDALDAIMRRMWNNVGRSLAEFSVLDRLWPAGRIEVVGAEHLAALRDARRPCLVIAPHLANWEVIGRTGLGLGHKGAAFYEPPKNRFQRRIADAARRRYGGIAVTPDAKGVREAIHILRDRLVPMVVYGDELKGGNVRAPSLGRGVQRRGNLVNIVRFARIANAAIVPALVERKQGAHFRTVIAPALELLPADDEDEMIRINVERLDAVLEAMVRPRLEQWFMLHDLRFDRPV